MDDLRKLHSSILDRKPVVDDLPEGLRDVGNACRTDKSHFLWSWGQQNLSSDDWDRIREAWAEEQRRAEEQAIAHALCRRRDEAALRSMYPGHAWYYEMVKSPPEFEERPMDAVVVVESGAGSLVRKAKAILAGDMAREALKVQYGGSPNKHSKRFNTDRFFHGYYTPEIEARLQTPRPDCERLRNTGYIQSACRRDITISTVRDWLESRGHRSVRLLLTYQSWWPHFALLIERLLGDFDICIDTNFDKRLPSRTSFLQEACMPKRGRRIWIDYEAYVATLFNTSAAK